jgi:hypothetical protein
MIQFIRSSLPLPRSGLGSRFLADPDLLKAIAERSGCSMTDAALSDQFSLVLHDVRMAGAWKRTNRDRLGETERMLCRHLDRGFPGELPVLDVGASDGVTSLDLLRALASEFGPHAQVVLTDLNLWLFRYRLGPIVEYRASDGEPILVRIGRFGLRLSQPRRGTAGGHGWLNRFYLGADWLRRRMRLAGRLALVNPLVGREARITVRELNCLARAEELVGIFVAARASNILNLGYFEPSQVAQAIGHLHSYLKERGCLVISRNRDTETGEVEDGSVWRREADRFVWLEDFGAGSEVRSTVDAWRRTEGDQAERAKVGPPHQ